MINDTQSKEGSVQPVHETVVTTSKPSSQPASSKPQAKRQPQYAVIVLNDEFHTFDYVAEALTRICGHSLERSYRLADEIHNTGLAAVWKGSLEVAELKRDQLLDFGPQISSSRTVTFPLCCYIEPLP
ncbi:ATP-dependent Clp protease adaptor ClpS [Schlesneria paludicola]|uniref:ATP-dependent Clp protease adaptor ClpS n=1 Tax=Schlesneria paludicola TaxID=360056 RepID=UPI00029ACB67|nr:ATP-dependent Clp protease adaptor ClpS [Schlesneria paludicola]